MILAVIETTVNVMKTADTALQGFDVLHVFSSPSVDGSVNDTVQFCLAFAVSPKIHTIQWYKHACFYKIRLSHFEGWWLMRSKGSTPEKKKIKI